MHRWMGGWVNRWIGRSVESSRQMAHLAGFSCFGCLVVWCFVCLVFCLQVVCSGRIHRHVDRQIGGWVDRSIG